MMGLLLFTTPLCFVTTYNTTQRDIGYRNFLGSVARSLHELSIDAQDILVVGECSSLITKKLLKLGKPLTKRLHAVEETCPYRRPNRINGIHVYRKAGVVIAAEDDIPASYLDAVIVLSKDSQKALANVVSLWAKLRETGKLVVMFHGLLKELFLPCRILNLDGYQVIEKQYCKNGPRTIQPVCEASVEVAKRSYCPGKRSRWEAAISVFLSKPRMTFVNIGANKGYNVAEFLSRFNHLGRQGVTNARWHEHLLSIDPLMHAPCGICRSTCSRPPPMQTFNTTATIYALELLESNAHVLDRMFKTLSLPGSVHQFAVLNYSGVAYAPSGKTGEEKFGARAIRRAHLKAVPAITVDDFAKQHQLHHVSILDINAEGSDALVLEGAKEMLQSRSVDIVKFEYHRVGTWALSSWDHRNLHDVVVTLYGQGYECFFDGNNGQMVPISDVFWCQVLEIRMWSNIVCAHNVSIRSVFHSLVFN
jgi:FkbM family methyltransferase